MNSILEHCISSLSTTKHYDYESCCGHVPFALAVHGALYFLFKGHKPLLRSHTFGDVQGHKCKLQLTAPIGVRMCRPQL